MRILFSVIFGAADLANQMATSAIANIIFAILVFYFKDFINIFSNYKFLNLSIFVLISISFYVLLLSFFKIFIFSNFQLFKLR